MAEINTLPKISEATRERLRSYGFTNHLYDYLNLPTYFIPRAPGFDAYTYLIMGLSVVGLAVCKKYEMKRLPFVISFICAPASAFYMKKQADTNISSQNSKRHPSYYLQFYPNLKQSFNIVNAEVDAEIQKAEERIRYLEGSQSRNE